MKVVFEKEIKKECPNHILHKIYIIEEWDNTYIIGGYTKIIYPDGSTREPYSRNNYYFNTFEEALDNLKRLAKNTEGDEI